MDDPMTLVLTALPGSGGAAQPALVCFPPAGAGASFYRRLAPRLTGPEEAPTSPVEGLTSPVAGQLFSTVWAVQYPGRESRLREPHTLTCAERSGEATAAIRAQLSSAPGVVLLGHSFGARVAFDTALQLRAEGFPVAGLIVSGCAAQVPAPGHRRHPDPHMSTAEALLTWVRELGGLPADLLACDELLALTAAALRADLIAAEAPASPADAVLDVPLLLLSADDDPLVPPAAMDDWAARTTAGSIRLDLHGGHHALLHDGSWLLATASWLDELTAGGGVCPAGGRRP
ncbi:thioesterase II family protein [Brevibacterium gallinarum]|uniref:Thioesterase n=1 Tax=Brevibacterium gallinarum TaxID=2762220 RepID=A0ABR8WS58_9MICO|nr:alpha/beta fold hydrolase [Brevibacterium gallinarum]MBD8019895.1 thioesterase [Brevibacterium gallinarum]